MISNSYSQYELTLTHGSMSSLQQRSMPVHIRAGCLALANDPSASLYNLQSRTGS